MKSLVQTVAAEPSLLAAWRQIKSKQAGGGVDGVSIVDFETSLGENIAKLSHDLLTGQWEPQPYLSVCIPKKEKETRRLGMLSLCDKVVQQALRMAIEPRIDRMFVNNSYGYRPQKGALRAIGRVRSFATCKRTPWALVLDIDDFFDNIDHATLFARLERYFHDEELCRLLRLCVQMGAVNRNMRWSEATRGVPQGAVLSPLLSNFYLHPFDQFVLTRTDAYVRYADNFVLFCASPEQAEQLLAQVRQFLSNRLKLSLNEPSVCAVPDGFEFLGITVRGNNVTLSESKENDLLARIDAIEMADGHLSPQSLKAYEGIAAYYGELLSQEILQRLDAALVRRLGQIVALQSPNRLSRSHLSSELGRIRFLSDSYQLNAKQLRREIFSHASATAAPQSSDKQNKQVVNRRKIEYHRLEAAGAELLVTSPGTFIGAENHCVVVRQEKKTISRHQIGQLKHLTIISKGVSLSSNAIDLCIDHRIPIDFFDAKGQHRGSFLSSRHLDASCWRQQCLMQGEQRFSLARSILWAKVKNQLSLVKYYNKYHSKTIDSLREQYERTSAQMEHCISSFKTLSYSDDYQQRLMSVESQAALCYWDYIRMMLKDDEVQFDSRQHQGATDLVNCMLNYGYAILYARVWQALLLARLNPYESVIHVRQQGKPTFVFDVIELFRAQAVDRVVLSLIQRGVPLSVSDGRLDDNTRKTLTSAILERLNRYEKYRGEEILFAHIIQSQAKEIAAFVADGVHYRPYLSKW